MENYKKLNLGCGQFPKAGFINVDFDKNSKADVIHDLSIIPYPFEDNSFEHIEMDHVLEHLPDTKKVMAELNRILRPDGTLIIRVPHFSRGYAHWEHKSGFDVTFPLYFDKTFIGGYTGIEFKHVSTKLVWFSQKYLKKKYLGKLSYVGGCFLGYIFDFLGNLNHFFSSRLLAFYVGGYEEIEFILKKPSNHL